MGVYELKYQQCLIIVHRYELDRSSEIKGYCPENTLKPLVSSGGNISSCLKPSDLAPKCIISQSSFDADSNNLIQFPNRVFSKCTRMAIMPILASEALFRKNRKFQLQNATPVSIEPLDL